MSRPGEDLLALAVDVAAEAARLVSRMRAEGVDVAHTKTSLTDVVTEADEAAQALIRRRLLTARPDDGFLGEEGDGTGDGTGDATGGSSGVVWVVDPIDGTVNYLYGSPDHAVSIAAQVDGVSVAGVVHAPSTSVVYTALRGGGSFQDGAPLRVRDVVAMGERLIHTGFSYEVPTRTRQVASVARMLPSIRDIRRSGSCALDLCAVAAGRCDGYVEEGTHLWDHAAASLVATEAGARFDVRRHPGGRDVVTCAPEGGFEAFADLCEVSGFFGNNSGSAPVAPLERPV